MLKLVHQDPEGGDIMLLNKIHFSKV